MTLASETGKVSWVCMGLRRVLILAEVSSLPSKSQDSLFGLKVVVHGAKPHGALPAVSGRAGSKTDPAGGRRAVASRYGARWNLCRFGLCSHAAASAVRQGLVLSLGLRGHHHHYFLSRHAGRSGIRQRHVPSALP
jgi:hypothetical protein